jgi:DNA-binding transcriptional MerR regulator
MEKALPVIPAKRYFTIGEVSELCGVKPYVLRYWEQEFTQLKPMKRRGNRRYYQHHEVLLIRRIRELLYDHGFTISGARNRLADSALALRGSQPGAASAEPAYQPDSEEAQDAALLSGPEDEVDAEIDAETAAGARMVAAERAGPAAALQAGLQASAASVSAAAAAARPAAARSSLEADWPAALQRAHETGTSPLQGQERALLRAELLSIRELLSF